MNIRQDYRHTLCASFVGYIVQAIINNFAPLLFLTFQTTYAISLDRIALLVTFNFGVQLLVDSLAAKFVDKIGYRISVVTAHLLCASGLIGLTLLPDWLGNPYVGLLASTVLYAVGGGLIEVLISPIVEACPTDRKEAAMSLLHSFYCWGHVAVVVISTAFFALFTVHAWKILALLWAVIPLANALYFSQVPLCTLHEETEGLSIRKLAGMRIFWIMLVMMLCAGAGEQAVIQWASVFAEAGLGVTKTLGDLAGPCAFAALMGLSRIFYAKFSEKISLPPFMLFSSVLCVGSYLLISLSPLPVLSLVGCALCGLSVGILWPGSFSIAAKEIRGGGTALFALLALAGDLGCSAGPTLVGFVSGALGDNLKIGILSAVVFPLLLILCLLLYIARRKKKAAAPPSLPPFGDG